MKSGLACVFSYFHSPLFWLLLFILCASITQTEDVVTKQTPATIQQNLPANNSKTQHAATEEEVTIAPVTESGSAREDELVQLSDGKRASSENDVRSSFVTDDNVEELRPQTTQSSLPAASSELAFVEVASQNAGISNEIADAGQIVVTLVDSATAALQNHAAEKSAPSSSQLDEQQIDSNVTSELVEDIPTIIDNSTISTNATEAEDEPQPTIKPPDGNLTTAEEIPSFSEWTQKQLEEAEKKREEVNTSAHHANANGKQAANNKVRSKNYASPDCGAKIVAANPEAISPHSVLSPSRDEYKLNACTSRIWFIVELCEAIQAKKIDLANFELFSSSPKDFTVSVSDRFPSREWSNVGQFTAKDERDVQSFDLHPHLFGKYIKLEMHSHHGSEHFCPISLFRVYGTSEFEVLEKEDDQLHTDDEDDDDALDSEKRPGPKNLFSSATDAVISIVKKAAEVLGNKGNGTIMGGGEDSAVQANASHASRYSPLISTCTTPSHIVVCDNCSDLLFGQVFELLSCRSRLLDDLLSMRTIRRPIFNSSVCMRFGFDFQSKRTPDVTVWFNSFAEAFLPPPYLGALCNTMAVFENKVVLNVSKGVNITEKETIPIDELHLDANASTTVGNSIETLIKNENRSNEETLAQQSSAADSNEQGTPIGMDIKPTKTLGAEETLDHPEFTTPPIEVIPTDVKDAIGEETTGRNGPSATEEQHQNEAPPIENGQHHEELDTPVESNEMELERLMSDLDANNTPHNAATPAPPKESVFLRLSNRIKTLERNMSLSSQYLEELSRRYKKQVEEMQRLLDKTINMLNEENQKTDEHNKRVDAKLEELTEIVAALAAERDNTFNPLHWLVLIVVTTVAIFTFCRRTTNEARAISAAASAAHHRRKSIDVVNHRTSVPKERRPSEEALHITGTYEHLLVADESGARKRTARPGENHLRKRKRKKGLLQRSNSITTLSDDHQTIPLAREAAEHEATAEMLRGAPSWSRQESAPAQAPPHWNADESPHPLASSNLDAAPIVLEESDNNPLQDMPLPKPLQERGEKKEKHLTNGSATQPMRKISSPAFLKAVEVRKPKSMYLEVADAERGHRKSASMDETKQRQSSPTPSTGNISLNLEDNNGKKKDKKGDGHVSKHDAGLSQKRRSKKS